MNGSTFFDRGIRNPLLAAALMLATACSPIGIMNATAPSTGIDIHRDLSYGKGSRQKLDVYAPRTAKSAPVVVFLYGGGWTEGSKKQYTFVAAALAARGIVTIVPDYRLYPEVRFPAFVEDGAAAVRWARDHAGYYGGDPRHIVLLGHSAGAYIAAMLALDPNYPAAVGMNADRDIVGCVGLAGPYDFLPLGTDELRAIFGPPETLSRTQPINFVTAEGPPMLLITGRRDDIVYPRNTFRLAAKLQAAGGRATTIVYPWVGHRLLIAAFARPFRLFAPVLDDVSRFVLARTRAAAAQTTPARSALTENPV